MIIIRPPIAAGSYYPIEKEELEKLIGKLFLKYEEKEEKILGAILPHVEYIHDFYALVYSKIMPSNFVIIGPNHLEGTKFSIMKEGIFKTPLGEIAVDSQFSEKLLNELKFLEFDLTVHNNEFSIEVQLPFLQHKFGGDFKIVPILIQKNLENLFEYCTILGEKLAKIIKESKRNWTIIATSNFSTLPKIICEETDNYLISSILKFDEKEFFDRINETNSGVCGYYPIICLISAVKKLGAKKGILLKYLAIEGILPDLAKAVGCASIIFI